MRVLPSCDDASLSSVQEAMAHLDRIFSSDWKERDDEIASCIGYLRSDGRLLRDWAIESMKLADRPDMIGAQSFMVHQTRSFMCRINLWLPEGSLGASSTLFGRYLSIGVLHNHDFNFFTTCLLGPGYTSLFHISSNGTKQLEIGEKIEVAAEHLVHLAGEKTIFVEKGVDFHTQYWPEQLSITLNVIPLEPLVLRQYSVDPATMNVKFVVNASHDLKHQLPLDSGEPVRSSGLAAKVDA